MPTFTCDDLRLGGTLAATGISGGISINGTAYTVDDWSTIFGSPGMSGSQVEVFGRAGFTTTGDLLPLGSAFNLNLAILDRDLTGGVTEPTLAEQKQANTDQFLNLLMSRGGVYLEVDMPDGTSRFKHVRNFNPAPIAQPRKLRTIRAPLVSDMAFWHQGGNQNSQVVNGATVLAVAGETVWDAVLTFSAATTFTHSGLGWAIQATAGTFPLVVDLGARTVTQGGNPATNRIRRTTVADMGRMWGWFVTGNNNVTAGANVTVTWRDQYG